MKGFLLIGFATLTPSCGEKDPEILKWSFIRVWED